MTVYGYARVSTDGQTLVAQDAALRAAGCAKVFSETASGAKTDRAALRKAVARLTESDTVDRDPTGSVAEGDQGATAGLALNSDQVYRFQAKMNPPRCRI